MNARTATAVGLRLIGLWFILDSLLPLFYGLFISVGPFASLPTGAHRRYYDAGQTVVAGLNLHETFYLIPHFNQIVAVVPGFLLGSILLGFSKPLARLLAHNLQDS